jgi:hypothetical protein
MVSEDFIAKIKKQDSKLSKDVEKSNQ